MYNYILQLTNKQQYYQFNLAHTQYLIKNEMLQIPNHQIIPSFSKFEIHHLVQSFLPIFLVIPIFL
jgi:hypothetical protein